MPVVCPSGLAARRTDSSGFVVYSVRDLSGDSIARYTNGIRGARVNAPQFPNPFPFLAIPRVGAAKTIFPRFLDRIPLNSEKAFNRILRLPGPENFKTLSIALRFYLWTLDRYASDPGSPGASVVQMAI